MPRQHPRPGEAHAKKLKEAQEKANTTRDDPKAPELLWFLLELVRRNIRGPYRTENNLFCLDVTEADSPWVCQRLEALRELLLDNKMCRTPIQDGLGVEFFFQE